MKKNQFETRMTRREFSGTTLAALGGLALTPLGASSAAASAGDEIKVGLVGCGGPTGELEVTYTLSSSNSAFPAFLARAPLGMVFEPAAVRFRHLTRGSGSLFRVLRDKFGWAHTPRRD